MKTFPISGKVPARYLSSLGLKPIRLRTEKWVLIVHTENCPISPDIILCDIMMPELDGYGVLHLLARRPETSTIPFIFLTARTERSDMRKGMEMGADDYLTKPFNEIELLQAVECQLKKREHQKLIFSQRLGYMQTLLTGKKGLEELRKLATQRKVRQVKRKQIIYYEGDQTAGIYLVISGNVKTFKVAEGGRELLTGIYGPEEYFGVAVMLSDNDYTESAEAIEDSVLCLLPKNMVEEMISKSPDVATGFIKLLATNVLSDEEQLLQLAYHSVRKRMAQLLVRLKVKLGDEDLSHLNLSREDLAGMAGIATETVSRILSDFKEEGLISRSLNELKILNVEKLEKMKN